MDVTFFTKLGLSFFIGGSWVVLATYIADKLGAKIGGLIAGLPSTVLFGLFFIAWTQNSYAAVTATSIVPIMGIASSIFLVLYSALVNLGLFVSLVFSLLTWSLIAYAAIRIPLPNYNTSLVIYALSLIVLYMLIEHVVKARIVKGKKIKYSIQILLLRGFLSGSIVGLSVLMGKLGGPILGGVFSLFPATFTSTLIVSYLSHGPKFSASIAKSALLASVSIVVYTIGVRYTYIPFGYLMGTFISTLISLFSGYFIYRFAIEKLK